MCCSPQVPASPGNGTGLAQNGMTVVGQNGTGPCQNSGGVAIQQQSSVWNMAQAAAPSPTGKYQEQALEDLAQCL